MPDLVLALREMDKNKTIHFVIDLEKAPLLFILYCRKIKQTNPSLKLDIYFRDESKLLPGVLQTYHLKYKNITEYPWDLPNRSNIIEEIDLVEKIDDWEEFKDDLTKIPDVYHMEDN